ncbi:MAG: GNAT family N-acetyltransferase, partial [Bacteroidia bacterium]
MYPYLYNDNLESNRLTTRKLKESDTTVWADFFKDQEVIQYFPIFYDTIEQRSKQWIERQLTRYAENRYGLQALMDKKTNEFIGQCGLLEQEVDGKKEIEVGYHIFKNFWGQGFAPEAARLFIDYAFNNKLTDSVISIIHKDK